MGLGLMSLVQILKLWRRIDHEKASVSNPSVGSSTYGGGVAKLTGNLLEPLHLLQKILMKVPSQLR